MIKNGAKKVARLSVCRRSPLASSSNRFPGSSYSPPFKGLSKQNLAAWLWWLGLAELQHHKAGNDRVSQNKGRPSFRACKNTHQKRELQLATLVAFIRGPRATATPFEGKKNTSVVPAMQDCRAFKMLKCLSSQTFGFRFRLMRFTPAQSQSPFHCAPFSNVPYQQKAFQVLTFDSEQSQHGTLWLASFC